MHSAWGGCLPLVPRRCLPGGVCPGEGVCPGGGCLPLVPEGGRHTPLWTDILPVKTYPSQPSFAGRNNYFGQTMALVKSHKNCSNGYKIERIQGTYWSTCRRRQLWEGRWEIWVVRSRRGSEGCPGYYGSRMAPSDPLHSPWNKNHQLLWNRLFRFQFFDIFFDYKRVKVC